MSSSNSSTSGQDYRMEHGTRLAGGSGMTAAKQTAIAKLRRLGLTSLLWEKSAYASGNTTAAEMAALVPQCDYQAVADLAVESRKQQGLRHTPLWLLRELIRIPEARKIAGQALAVVMDRPDQITEFLSLYWLDAKNSKGERAMIPEQVKQAISTAFNRFDEYQLQKYNRDGKAVGLKDAIFLAHAKPKDLPKEAPIWNNIARRTKAEGGDASPKRILFDRFVEGDLPIPMTREVLLSAAKTTEEKAAAYVSLIETKKMPANAMLKSIRHMIEVGIPGSVITQGLQQVNPERILPLDFLAAMQHAPAYEAVIEGMMLRCLKKYPRLTGKTIVVVDMSGSMGAAISSKSEFTRMDAALALAMMAKEMSDDCSIWLTAGGGTAHSTEMVPATLRGLAIRKHSRERMRHLGGGGIFTRQALDFIKSQLGDAASATDRTIVISDSQDCDYVNKVPKPFSAHNYIVDVAAHQNGINYAGVWTAEISGWSQSFLHYVAEAEKLTTLG